MASALERSGTAGATFIAASGLASREKQLYTAALQSNLAADENAAVASGSGAATSMVAPSAQNAPSALRLVLQGAASESELAQPRTVYYSRHWTVAQFLLQLQQTYATAPLVQLRDGRGVAVTDISLLPATSAEAAAEVFTAVPADSMSVATGDPTVASTVPYGLTAAVAAAGALSDPSLPLSDPLYRSLSSASAPALDVAEHRILARAGWRDFAVVKPVAETGAST